MIDPPVDGVGDPTLNRRWKRAMFLRLGNAYRLAVHRPSLGDAAGACARVCRTTGSKKLAFLVPIGEVRCLAAFCALPTRHRMRSWFAVLLAVTSVTACAALR